MKKRRSRKENKTDLKKEPNTPSEVSHETVEIIERTLRRARESERR